MAIGKVGKTAAPERRRGKARWVALAAIALAGFVAVEAGWAGFGWAQLRAAVFPRDESLLGWVPGDASMLLVVDTHLLDLKALGPEGSPARTTLETTRDDVKKATGIDLAFDVDKLVLSPSLAVLRGRFDDKKLAERLAEHRYAPVEHKGVRYLARQGEDAIAVIDGDVLLYGDAPSIEAAIDAHEGGTSLEKNERLTARLRRTGWDHPVIATARFADDKPSLRQILSGGGGPQAVSAAFTTLSGLDVDASVESASINDADELRKLLDDKRGSVDALAPYVGPDVAPILANAAKKATLTVDPTTNAVKIHAHLDQADVDTLIKKGQKSKPLADAYKTLRLFQLLVPTG